MSVDLALYPIDTLKTRLQSSAGFQLSGGFRGIYAGVGAAALGSAPGASLFFVTYEWAKTFLHRNYEVMGLRNFKHRAWAEPLEHMIAASAGEVVACAVRVPTDVLKQRAQAFQAKSSLEALNAVLIQRRNIGLLGVWRELYRGWNLTIMRDVPFTVIQCPLWECMKAWRRRQTGEQAVSAIESGFFGSIAGLFAGGVTTPLDVLKTRMMLSKDRLKTSRLMFQILNEGGLKAFFAGVVPRVIWLSAGGAIYFGSYQWANNTLMGI